MVQKRRWAQGGAGRPLFEGAGEKNHNVGEHAALWNRMLQEDGHAVQLERVRFKAGSSPWVGTRSTFKKIYKFL